MAGVVVGARVRVLRDQRFRFLGYIFEDGSFALVSGLDIEPLRLEIDGIRLRVPLEIEARLTLAGRGKRDGGFAFISAEGRGAWDLIPNVLRVEAGQKSPLRLELDSRGKFRLSGGGAIYFFDNPQALLSAEVDISESHFFARGQFHYTAGSVDGVTVIQLSLIVTGRIGPAERFDFAGGGRLQILGRPFAAVRGAISDRGAEIDAHLDTGKWVVGGLEIDARLILDVSGRFALAPRKFPVFALAARGCLELLGAKIEGSGVMIADSGRVEVGLDGRLFWQNREWLGGAISIRSNGGVKIRGRTAFALHLTPSQLPGNIKVASLYFRIDVGGSFILDPAGGFASCELDLDWDLGVELSGGGDNQLFSIASQKLRISQKIALWVNLVNISALQFLPIGGFTIPVPTGVSFGGSLIIEGVKLWPLLGAEVILTEDLADEAEGLSFVTSTNGKPDRRKLVEVPTSVELTVEDMPLTTLLGDMDFSVSLVWKDLDLGVEVAHAGRRTFTPFRKMFPE
jgi:hypothetical protein